MAAENDKLEIVPERTVEVRETRKLFRLAPAAGWARSPRHFLGMTENRAMLSV